MALPTKKSLPKVDFDEPIVEKKKPSIRDTQKWKNTYNRFLSEKESVFGNSKRGEEAYCRYIDKLANHTVNQTNIMSSWNSFKPESFDSYFKEQIAEFGSEENYYKWLEKEQARLAKESEKKYEQMVKENLKEE